MTLKDVFKKVFRKFLKLLWWAFLTSTIYLVVCIWIMPPITITQIANLAEGYGLKRDYVSNEQIAPAVRLAAMASEDQLFPDHGGFDWRSLEKSLQQKGSKRKRKRGAAASTISQQVAKNVFLWQGTGISRYIRKVPEMYFTKMIEWIWGKERILEVYLNVAEMGEGIFGIEAAAQQYFKKPASKLSRAEAAMIIASLPNPKRYTVKPVSRWVSWRHQQILREMRNIEMDPEVRALVYLKSPAKAPAKK